MNIIEGGREIEGEVQEKGEVRGEVKGEAKGGEVRESEGDGEEATWTNAMEERGKISSLIGELEGIRVHALDSEHKNVHYVKNADG